jgi:hypothetical protein
MIVAEARLTPSPSKSALSSQSFLCHVDARASLLATSGPGEKYRDTKAIMATGAMIARKIKTPRLTFATCRYGCDMLMSRTQNVWTSGLTFDNKSAMTAAALEPCHLLMECQQHLCLHYDKPIKNIRAQKPVEGHLWVDPFCHAPSISSWYQRLKVESARDVAQSTNNAESSD